MIAKGVHGDCIRTASPIDADRTGLIHRGGIERTARGGPMGCGRATGSDARTRTGLRLRWAIGNALMNPTPENRIPAHLVALLTRMRRLDRALRGELGRAPTFDEVAAALDLSDAQKAVVIGALRSLRMRPPVCSDPGEDEPILLTEVIEESEDRDGRAE